MARNAEFYKGVKKRKTYYFVPVAGAVALVALLVVLFYSMQKYAVITKDDVKVSLPMLGGGNTDTAYLGTAADEAVVFEHTTVSIRLDEPD